MGIIVNGGAVFHLTTEGSKKHLLWTHDPLDLATLMWKQTPNSFPMTCILNIRKPTISNSKFIEKWLNKMSKQYLEEINGKLS